MNTQDLFDIAESVIMTAQKLKNGANVHDLTSGIALVQCWMNHVKHAESLDCNDPRNAEVIEDLPVRTEFLLDSINRLREMTLKFSS